MHNKPEMFIQWDKQSIKLWGCVTPEIMHMQFWRPLTWVSAHSWAERKAGMQQEGNREWLAGNKTGSSFWVGVLDWLQEPKKGKKGIEELKDCLFVEVPLLKMRRRNVPSPEKKTVKWKNNDFLKVGLEFLPAQYCPICVLTDDVAVWFLNVSPRPTC